jgi:hypothetical protein
MKALVARLPYFCTDKHVKRITVRARCPCPNDAYAYWPFVFKSERTERNETDYTFVVLVSLNSINKRSMNFGVAIRNCTNLGPCLWHWRCVTRHTEFGVEIHSKQTSTVCIHSVAPSPRANYTDWTTATCRRNLMPTFVDRGVSRGQRGWSLIVVNLSFLDRSRYFSFK